MRRQPRLHQRHHQRDCEIRFPTCRHRHQRRPYPWLGQRNSWRRSATHRLYPHFSKMFQAAVKSCSQGGVRGGAATLFYPLWHIEAESLLVLKNNRGVEDNRIRQLDYGVQINRLLYTRLIKGGNITLFSPNEVPGLYDRLLRRSRRIRAPLHSIPSKTQTSANALCRQQNYSPP